MGKRIFFNNNFDFTNEVINGDKTIELLPIQDNIILNQYNNFTLGSRITGLNGYSEWKKEVIKKCNYQINEKIAIAQPYKEIYDNTNNEITNLKGFDDRRYTSYNLLKNFITINKVDICKIENLLMDDYKKLGIKEGCMFDTTTFSFKTNYYFIEKEKVNTFDNIKDAYFFMSKRLFGKYADGLFYKIEFNLNN